MAIQFVQYPVITIATPTGGSTSALQTTGNTSLASIDTKTPSLVSGRQPVDGSGVTQPVSAASLPLPTGASTSALQTTGNTSLSSIDSKITAVNTGAVVVSSSALPAGAATSAAQTTAQTSLTSIDGKFGSLGQKAMTGSTPVVLASDQAAIPVSQSGTWTVQPGNTANTTAWLVTQGGAGTSTLSNVSSSATTVSILASNASRKGATFFNESTSVLYLKFGTTASLTSYTVQIPANSYYELPFIKPYTGAIDGIWASANGTLRVTELS